MSKKRHKNGPSARLGRLVGLLAFVVLMAVIYLLSPGSPLRAAPKPALLDGPTYFGGIIITDTAWTAADSPYVVTANTLVSIWKAALTGQWPDGIIIPNRSQERLEESS